MTVREIRRQPAGTAVHTTRVKLAGNLGDEASVWDDLRNETRVYVRGRDLIERRALLSLVRLIDRELSEIAGRE